LKETTKWKGYTTRRRISCCRNELKETTKWKGYTTHCKKKKSL